MLSDSKSNNSDAFLKIWYQVWYQDFSWFNLFFFVRYFISRCRICRLNANVTIVGEELHNLDVARHIWPLTRKRDLSCHTCSDKLPWFYPVICEGKPRNGHLISTSNELLITISYFDRIYFATSEVFYFSLSELFFENWNQQGT